MLLWAGVWALTTDLPAEAAAYPRFVLTLLFIATGIYTVKGLFRLRQSVTRDVASTDRNTAEARIGSPDNSSGESKKRLLVFIMGTIAYAVLIPLLGFDLITAVFLMVSLRYFTDVKVTGLVVVGVLPFILQWVTAAGLGVTLPEGFWR